MKGDIVGTYLVLSPNGQGEILLVKNVNGTVRACNDSAITRELAAYGDWGRIQGGTFPSNGAWPPVVGMTLGEVLSAGSWRDTKDKFSHVKRIGDPLPNDQDDEEAVKWPTPSR